MIGLTRGEIIDLKVDKLVGFFIEFLDYGYDYETAWNYMLTEKEGQGILNEEYLYIEHQEGSISAKQVIERLHLKRGSKKIKYSADTLELLGYLIEMAHTDERYMLPYEKIFSKYSINDFVTKQGYCIGDYDSKLIDAYLI